MACCAFAIYLVSLVLWPLRRMLRLGREPQWQADPAVEWRPGAPATPRRPSVLRRALQTLLLALGGTAVLAGTAAVAAPQQARSLESAIHASICGELP
ncbi:hypothetical protein NSE01_28800 [Novosphingobium sediminis]|uniref:Uncharacterized protein n=1 Tax=Novosphingobium sediminis TaxID=707214 RepID=A0A512AMX8_9SPHN|nr:hypothetical protein [Novosphingobium sediminis]GEO01048.1 hypothetical protein NSE01_28800 [Novosphingobium sediminis]